MPLPSLPLSNEDELNLSSSIFDDSEGNLRTTNGKNLIRLNTDEIPEDLAKISDTAILKLYNEVSGYCSSNKDCLTAIRFYFGVEMDGEAKKMKLFYEPLFMAFDKVNPESGEREYIITEKGNISSFNGTTFVTESIQDLQSAQVLFRDNLKLKHYPISTDFEDFITGTDTESLVLPFQTIFALVNDNGAEEFTIKHCAEISLSDDVKESLILSAVENSNNGPFAGKFVNRLGHEPPISGIFNYVIV